MGRVISLTSIVVALLGTYSSAPGGGSLLMRGL